ncbi:hypothetical protein SDC9_93423 [bioreactor metagenome]|uniref:Uncharacterized protein n=1 Tax=bioreactor metagenome TaxID=1076179 RepID=A0A645A0Y4_9ZZZZ
MRETARDNLKKFLSLIGIYAEDAEINTNNTVYQEEYIKDGLEVGSSINYGIRISNTSFDVDINTSPEDILKLINNDIRIKSACIYNNIKNPFVYKTVRYYQSGEFMGKICEVTFKIIDKSNYINDAQNNVIKYVEITYNLEFTAESRCILRIANEPVTEISVKEEDAVSYDEALDFLQKGYYYLGKGLFPSIIIPVSLSEVEFCELTYTNIFNYISLPNNKITPAYYIPCYKFYVKGEKDQNVPELTDYYICYIPAIRNYAVFPDKY